MRFSNAELRFLREGHTLFAGKGGKGGASSSTRWIKQTLEKFAFHPSRTEQSLKQKWHQMSK